MVNREEKLKEILRKEIILSKESQIVNNFLDLYR